ncbi:hypothetical protein LOC54_00735 [Acetobacter sp. AN02]|uniref:hypothetical protein n=1 Tax=Acetobacter sp. AN02 TaxID=2894186 RepID=UPI00243463F6|nr:hypothetical protein [Acetobacter sp. AN02]MDG6093651.1 hypothetical protein [Acetobacter sp. AN02]
MRIIEAGQSTLGAQGELLKFRAARIGRQVAFLVVAAVFGFFSVITGHFLVWALFRYEFGLGPVAAPLAVFGLDILMVLFFAFLGRRSFIRPGELDAIIRLDRSRAELRQALTFGTLTTLIAGPIGQALWNRTFGRKKR